MKGLIEREWLKTPYAQALKGRADATAVYDKLRDAFYMGASSVFLEVLKCQDAEGLLVLVESLCVEVLGYSQSQIEKRKPKDESGKAVH